MAYSQAEQLAAKRLLEDKEEQEQLANELPPEGLTQEEGISALEGVTQDVAPVPLGQTPVDRMGVVEGFKAGVTNEWLVPSLINTVQDETYAPDPDWINPVLQDKEVPLGYRTNLARARSQDHYDDIKEQIMEEMEHHRRLQGATGWGVAGYMVAAMVDPALLVTLPFEEVMVGQKVARLGKLQQVLKTGLVAGGANALQESALVATKETRGIDDILAAGAAGALLGGGIRGAAIGVQSIRGSRKTVDQIYDEYVRNVLARGDDSLNPAPIDKVVDPSAPKPTEIMPEQIGKDVIDERSVNEAYRHNEAFKQEIKSRSEANIAKGGPSMTELSMGERLRKNRNGVVAALADRLLENPAGTGGKTVRKATADLLGNMRERMLGSTYTDFDNLYKQWYTRQGKSWYNARIAGKGREEFGEAIMRELDARRAGRFINSDPAVKQVADQITPKFNKMSLDMHKKSGVLGADKVKHDANYYPRQWNFEKMHTKGKSSVIEIIARAFKGAHPDAPVKDAEKIGKAFWRRFEQKYTQSSGANSHMFNTDTRDTLQDFLEDLVDDDTVADIMRHVEPTRGRQQAPGSLQRRVELDMDAQLDDGTTLYDLLETDYGLMLSRQTREVAGRSALADIGVKSEQDWEQLIRMAREEAAIDPRLAKDTDIGIDHLETAKRNLLGQSTILNPNSTGARAARDLKDLTFLSRMGQMGLAQATELSNLVAEQGITSIVKAVPQLRRLTKMAKAGTMPKELAEDLAALGWKVGDQHLMNLPYYRVDDGGLKVSNFGDTPFTAHWRNGLVEGKRILGYVSLQNSIMRKEQELWKQSTMVRFFDDAMGTSKLSQRRLNDIGLGEDTMKAIRANIKKHGGKFEHQGIITLGLDKWDKETLEAFRIAMVRQNSQSIQGNMIGDMPAWAMNSKMGQLMLQFRSFPLVAWAKQTKRNAKFMDATTFGAFAYAVPICAAIHIAKANINSLGLSSKERKKVLDAQLSDKGMALGVVRYMPVASLAPDALSALAPFTGQDFSSPYRSGTSRAADMSVGSISPSFGLINETYTGVQNLVNPNHEMSARDIRRFLGILPGSNVIGVKNAINALSESLGK